MIKKHLPEIIIATALLFSTHMATAQGLSVNATGTPADTSAMLDVNSTTKGMLIPRMNNSQRGLIHLPATGLMIFQTDGTPGFYYNSGTPASPAWTAMSGASSAGTIIPFASGLPITMTTDVSGVPETGSVIGFGNSAQGISVFGPAIDITGGPATLLDFAFSMPRSGTITSIAAYFSCTGTPSLDAFIITAQLYQSTAPNNIFTAIPGAESSIPFFSGLFPGDVGNGIISGLSIAVTPGTRLMMFYTIEDLSGIGVSVSGYASGAINIQ